MIQLRWIRHKQNQITEVSLELSIQLWGKAGRRDADCLVAWMHRRASDKLDAWTRISTWWWWS